MINLLPPEQLSELRAARANTLLLRYNIFLVGVLVFIMLALVVVYFYLTTIQDTAIQTKRDNDQKVATYSKVNDQATEFRNNLANAKTILDKDITYSKTLLAISNLLPHGVIFDTITLDASAFGSPTVLALKAKDEAAAVAAKDAFSKSPMFSDVHFTSVSRKGPSRDAYPVDAGLSVVISKDAAK